MALAGARRGGGVGVSTGDGVDAGRALSVLDGAGRELVRALQAVPAYGLRPIGFLDDNIGLGRVNGLPVLGELAALPDVAQSTGAKAALVAIPSLKPGA